MVVEDDCTRSILYARLVWQELFNRGLMPRDFRISLNWVCATVPSNAIRNTKLDSCPQIPATIAVLSVPRPPAKCANAASSVPMMFLSAKVCAFPNPRLRHPS